MRKLLFTAAALSIMITQTGCFGSFSLVKKVYEFNDGATDNKFVKSLLFLVLSFIPVYGVSAFLDIAIFNLIEFWSGSNPLSMEAGEVEEQLMTINGKVYKVTATQNRMSFAELTNGEVIDMGAVFFSNENKTWNFEKDGLSEVFITFNDDNSVDFNTLAGVQSVDMSTIDCLVLDNFKTTKNLELAVK